MQFNLTFKAIAITMLATMVSAKVPSHPTFPSPAPF
jgi:hypothetical protein